MPPAQPVYREPGEIQDKCPTKEINAQWPAVMFHTWGAANHHPFRPLPAASIGDCMICFGCCPTWVGAFTAATLRAIARFGDNTLHMRATIPAVFNCPLPTPATTRGHRLPLFLSISTNINSGARSTHFSCANQPRSENTREIQVSFDDLTAPGRVLVRGWSRPSNVPDSYAYARSACRKDHVPIRTTANGTHREADRIDRRQVSQPNHQHYHELALKG